MKALIQHIVADAVTSAMEKGELAPTPVPEIVVEEPKNPDHGDFAVNTAMVMAKAQKMPPRKIAECIAKQLHGKDPRIAEVMVAGPGFINLRVAASAWLSVLSNVFEAKDRFGACKIGHGKKVQVEFVSANPTGPLHVGHGRGAAVGDAVARILAHAGYSVQKEYYINDAGRQIRTLGKSVWLRYQELFGKGVTYPDDCYQGDYIKQIAEAVEKEKGDSLLSGEKAGIEYCARYAADTILEEIKDDLAAFNVSHDQFFSEQSLYDDRLVEKAIKACEEKKVVYEKDGALWFDTTRWGDEKDRVVVKKDKDTTYFASDIAYHAQKYERGFDWVIDVWGADHHGYIPRMAAAIQAFGKKREQFDVILVKLVNLLRDGQPVAMSTRAGEFVTLRDVVDEVGADAARFLFLMRHWESPLDFDLALAKKKTNENPVYYVQYVHARIASIVRKYEERGGKAPAFDKQLVKELTGEKDLHLLKVLARFPETVKIAATGLEPHRIAFYLTDLASAFHAYYNHCRVLTDDENETRARLLLIMAVQVVIKSGLALLGVSAPDSM